MLSTSTISTQISSLILQPLVEFDPHSLAISPILVESLPLEESISEGEFTGGKSFTFKLRDDAVWSDGKPVTVNDYLFTLKAVFTPGMETNAWRSFLANISKVVPDSGNPKMFKVIVGEAYMQAMLIASNFNIYPQHIYDPNGYLNNINLEDLLDAEKAKALASNESIKSFVASFSSATFTRETVEGSGPYQLKSWDANQGLSLTKKENWWGDKYAEDISLFQAYPKSIVYSIMPDEAASLTALKEGSIDLMNDIKPANFLALQADETYAEKLAFHSPSLLGYYYLGLNNGGKFTSDKNVRRALALLVDVPSIINVVMKGAAKQTVGPVSPNSKYYNASLNTLTYNLDKAKQLLKEAGWVDTNGNGTLDKVIDGKLTEFEISIMTTQRQLGKDICAIAADGFKKAGVNLSIDSKPFNLILQDLNKRDYDLAALASRHSPGLWDPYQNWHSSSDVQGGSNRAGFRNDRADELIEMIRSTTDESLRNSSYKELQEIIYNEQVHIFLFAPAERIAVNKKFDLKSSSRRPGFFEQQLKLN
jgi:peptide/nickel transport system substrate-binding protein